jgi:hypothetical protein
MLMLLLVFVSSFAGLAILGAAIAWAIQARAELKNLEREAQSLHREREQSCLASKPRDDRLLVFTRSIHRRTGNRD